MNIGVGDIHRPPPDEHDKAFGVFGAGTQQIWSIDDKSWTKSGGAGLQPSTALSQTVRMMIIVIIDRTVSFCLSQNSHKLPLKKKGNGLGCVVSGKSLGVYFGVSRGDQRLEGWYAANQRDHKPRARFWSQSFFNWWQCWGEGISWQFWWWTQGYSPQIQRVAQLSLG